MFDKEYAFKGSHAEKVIKLTAKIDDRNQIFCKRQILRLPLNLTPLL